MSVLFGEAVGRVALGEDGDQGGSGGLGVVWDATVDTPTTRKIEITQYIICRFIRLKWDSRLRERGYLRICRVKTLFKEGD